MPNSTVVKDWKDGLVTVKDGTGTPISVTEKFGNGDFQFSGMSADMRALNIYRGRGSRTGARYGDQIEASGSFSVQVAEFTSATATSIVDAILKNGAFAAAVSTLGANAEVYTLDLTFTMEGSDLGDSDDHEVTFEDCHCTVDFAEGQPNVATINWVCLGAITGDLAAG
jgi:hypothetical protein